MRKGDQQKLVSLLFLLIVSYALLCMALKNPSQPSESVLKSFDLSSLSTMSCDRSTLVKIALWAVLAWYVIVFIALASTYSKEDDSESKKAETGILSVNWVVTVVLVVLGLVSCSSNKMHLVQRLVPFVILQLPLSIILMNRLVPVL